MPRSPRKSPNNRLLADVARAAARRELIAVLRRNGGNICRSARALGMRPQRVYEALATYEIARTELEALRARGRHRALPG